MKLSSFCRHEWGPALVSQRWPKHWRLSWAQLSCQLRWWGGFITGNAADTFSLSCSASLSASLLCRWADSVAVMRSITGTCGGVMATFSPVVRTSFSGWVRDLYDRFLVWCGCVVILVSPGHLFCSVVALPWLYPFECLFDGSFPWCAGIVGSSPQSGWLPFEISMEV